MHIAVIGATGRTGKLVIEQALARGHSVTGLARTPAAVTVMDPHLRIARADVLEKNQLAAALDGCRAVISTLGIGTSRAATEVYSSGIANILSAVPASATTRLVVVSAAPVGPPHDRPGLGNKLINGLLWRFFGATYRDMQQMEHLLRFSDVSWTSLRPPRLLDKPATGSYRIGTSPPPGGRSLRYGDLATALLDVLEQSEHLCSACYVSN